MQSRRIDAAVHLIIIAALLAAFVAVVPALEAVERPSLQKALESGLKARLPREFAFIAKVVALVENGTLEKELVEGTMVWARRQHSRPFPYFERGLRERARRIGIKL